ncbi:MULTISPECIES: elongation factor P [Deinococcus]|jgi:elongation factor P|uniref:Elongation factor P n=2 Tax=Deinococcus TaxID=1298 RepID=A0A221SSR3_9DEIO|nr:MULTISPECIES: elongation factor P [Deinococcus]ASN79677.1 elongation factor P [Deinococcus ficus]MDP9765348.1 elongation factor P [Deinococcus enclensis]GHF87064.1 elongation factor P [Deinococcus ficus]
MISVTELRNGTKVEMDGGLWECLDYSHLKMGRGGAKVVTKFRNMETGSIVDRTFNSGEKLQDIYVEGKKMQYLYPDGDDYVFMDLETFDQIHLGKTLVGDAAKFMKENTEVEVAMFGDKALSITLPNQVILKIVETDPGVRGDTVSGGTKPAKLETGAVVQVPLFVEQDTNVKVDTRTGQYLSRA